MVSTIAGGMARDPGHPTTISTRPSRSTIVGAIVEAGTRKGPEALGAVLSREKLNIALLKKTPSIHVPVPKPSPSVLVTETALPSESTTDMCVVSDVDPSGCAVGFGALSFEAAIDS